MFSQDEIVLKNILDNIKIWLLQGYKMLGESNGNRLQQKQNIEQAQIAMLNINRTLTTPIKQSNAKNPFFNSKESEEEFMRLNKNTRKRTDGRYEWRKMINGKKHFFIHSNPFELAKIVREYKKEIIKEPIIKDSQKLIDLCEKNANYKQNKTAYRYKSVVNNHMQSLTRNINKYSKNDIQDFFSLENIKKIGHRNAAYCWYIIKNVFADAHAEGKIKTNPISNYCPNFPKGKKGKWIELENQKTLLKNLNKCKFGKELLFYLMTGCRCEEALNAVPYFDKKAIYVTRTKVNETSGYVKISAEYCKMLKADWSNMFKQSAEYYSRNTTIFLKSINIYGKTLHSLRHTFSSNIYYLGCPPKEHQYMMGHKNIKMTYDIYTTYDPYITKKHILDIYNNLYPKF